MIDGITVSAGGRDWIVPEMRTKTARAYLPYISGSKKLPDDDPEAMLDLLGNTVLSILKPNYPEITRDEIEELFSPSDYRRIIEAAATQAGLAPSGEAQTESTPPH